MPATRRTVIKRLYVIRLFILGLLMYLIAAGFGGLRLIVDAIKAADLRYLVVAVLAVVLSYVCATFTYIFLAYKKIPFTATFLVEIATGLTNRLLPAGLGGLGLNAYYLKKRGHSLPVAVSIVGTNNLLGFFGNFLLILCAIFLFGAELPHIPLPSLSWEVLVMLAIVCAIMVVYIRKNRKATRTIIRSLYDFRTYIVTLLHRPFRTFSALLSSILLTALHAAALYCVLTALKVDATAVTALLAISAGAMAGAALPTPGGLGGAEAGIASMLVASAIPVSMAVPAALVYRGITYWLPLLPGYVALRVAEKRYL